MEHLPQTVTPTTTTTSIVVNNFSSNVVINSNSFRARQLDTRTRTRRVSTQRPWERTQPRSVSSPTKMKSCQAPLCQFRDSNRSSSTSMLRHYTNSSMAAMAGTLRLKCNSNSTRNSTSMIHLANNIIIFCSSRGPKSTLSSKIIEMVERLTCSPHRPTSQRSNPRGRPLRSAPMVSILSRTIARCSNRTTWAPLGPFRRPATQSWIAKRISMVAPTNNSNSRCPRSSSSHSSNKARFTNRPSSNNSSRVDLETTRATIPSQCKCSPSSSKR